MPCFNVDGDSNFNCYPRKKRRKKNKQPNFRSLNGMQNGDLKTKISAKSYDSHHQTQMPDDGMVEGGLEFVPITKRISALLFPTNCSDQIYRAQIKNISERLRRSYADKYKIFNVSQKRSDLGRANPAGTVLELGWPGQVTPMLDRLCSICKQIENYLTTNPENIVIIHCKGYVCRAGLAIAAYKNYINICATASEETVEDRFSMQLFAEKNLIIDGQPSHRRYINYFCELLSGTIKVYSSPIFLTRISLRSLFPNRIIIMKIYERMKPVWTSREIKLGDYTEIDVNNGAGLPLRGDILIKCFDFHSLLDEANNNANESCSLAKNCNQDAKKIFFQCQLNTCALNINAFKAPMTISFAKHEIDLVFNDGSVDSSASLNMDFALEQSAADNHKLTLKADSDHIIKQQLTASTPNAKGNIKMDGEFSRADSYENFERAEDDRSNSLPLPSSPIVPNSSSAVQNLLTETSATATRIVQPQEKERQLEQTDIALPNIDPGINVNEKTENFDSGISSDSSKNNTKDMNSMAHLLRQQNNTPNAFKKLPPEVPPKPLLTRRRRSLTNYEDDESLGPEDPLRTALEDSTIGRDHSALPSQVRPRRNGNDEDQQSLSRSATASAHNIEPDLVVKGRYDPNSRCFSYVPAKSLKEHYQSPKKQSTPRRSSIEPTDLDEVIKSSPLTMDSSMQSLNFPSVELKRRAETPKWDAEIDKVAGPMEIPRRASTAGSLASFLRHRESHSPPRQPEDDFFLRRFTPTSTGQVSIFPVGGMRHGPPLENSKATDSYEAKIRSQHDDNVRVARGQLENAIVLNQAKRATKMPARRSASGPTNKTDMDEFLDPDFYMSYSPVPERNKRINELDSLSKSYIAPESSKRFDVPGTHLMKEITNTSLPQHQKRYPFQHHGEDFRKRNCQSVNSTPISRERKLFTHNRYDALNDAEDADDWLINKLQALKSKRFFEPDYQKRRHTERMLLEELKSMGPNESPRGPTRSSKITEDPLEEYRREEMRLKNTRSPFVDELRLANKKLQKAFDEGRHLFQPINKQPQKQYSRSISATPDVARSRRPATSVATSPVGVHRAIATPTSGLMREKPPTPPINRERSQSPAFQQLKQRQMSNSVPPHQNRPIPSYSDLPESAVNPNLYAIRQSLYQKERERMGIKDPNSTRNQEPLFTSAEDDNEPNASYTSKNAIGNYPMYNRISTTVRDSPVKSILKNSGSKSDYYQDTWSLLGSARETPMSEANDVANLRKECPQDYIESRTTKNRTTRTPTPNYESTPTPAQGRNYSDKQNTERLPFVDRDRSDTPAFPTSETPLPYHPLLYRRDSTENRVHPSYKLGNTPVSRYGSRTPQSMPHTNSWRSSITSMDTNQDACATENAF